MERMNDRTKVLATLRLIDAWWQEVKEVEK
jgi:hypothetical protein